MLMLLMVAEGAKAEDVPVGDLSVDFLGKIRGTGGTEAEGVDTDYDQQEGEDPFQEVLVQEGGVAVMDCTDQDLYKGQSVEWKSMRGDEELPEGSEVVAEF